MQSLRCWIGDPICLRGFALRGGELADRLTVDPRPIVGRNFPTPSGHGITTGPVVAVRRSVLQGLGVRESNDRDLPCGSNSWDSTDPQGSADVLRRCVERGLLWVYVSATVRADAAIDGMRRAAWRTRVSATAGGLQYVVVDVVTRWADGNWEVTEVRMVENVMVMERQEPLRVWQVRY